MIARLICKYLGHRKPFRIMGPMIWENHGLWRSGHNATVGCFYCGARRRTGGVYIGSDPTWVIT